MGKADEVNHEEQSFLQKKQYADFFSRTAE
jgi:hypothetical protein